MTSMSRNASCRLANSRQESRCQSGVLKITLYAMILAIAPQLAFASEACSLFDRIVAASEENPPFGSVVHWSIPKTECEVDGGWEIAAGTEARRSYTCVWPAPTLDDHKYRAKQARDAAGDARRRAHGARRDLEDKWDEFEEDRDDYNERAQEYNDFVAELNDLAYERPDVVNHPQFIKAHRSAEREKRKIDDLKESLEEREPQLEAEEQRVVALQAEAERLKEAVERSKEKIETHASSQARILLNTIKNCLHKGKIRGSWGPFATDGDGNWSTIRDERDCRHSRCEMRIESGRNVLFESVVLK